MFLIFPGSPTSWGAPLLAASILPGLWAGWSWYRAHREDWYSTRVSGVLSAALKFLIAAPAWAVLPMIVAVSLAPPLLRQEHAWRADGLQTLNSVDFISHVGDDVGLYRYDEVLFVRRLLAENYYWPDGDKARSTPARHDPEAVFRAGLIEFDRWSGVLPYADAVLLQSGVDRGLGVIDGRPSESGYQVLRIAPESPAAIAGLGRGDVIVAVDNARYPSRSFFNGLFDAKVGIRHLSILRLGGQIEAITVQTAYFPEPKVDRARVIRVPGQAVGYLPYHGFGASWREDLSIQLRELAMVGVDAMILDLRYNHGGEAMEVGILAGMLAPRAALGQRALTMRTGSADGRAKSIDIAIDQARPIADPANLIVITSQHTCSAAEALVKALRPYMQVTTIGSGTCGKPYGFRGRAYMNRVYWAVEFDVANALEQRFYVAGIPADCPAADDARYALGNPEEASLRSAIHYARTGHCLGGGLPGTRARG